MTEKDDPLFNIVGALVQAVKSDELAKKKKKKRRGEGKKEYRHKPDPGDYGEEDDSLFQSR